MSRHHFCCPRSHLPPSHQSCRIRASNPRRGVAATQYRCAGHVGIEMGLELRADAGVAGVAGPADREAAVIVDGGRVAAGTEPPAQITNDVVVLIKQRRARGTVFGRAL